MPHQFPIPSGLPCLLKWGWSSVYFNSGTTSSCHRTNKIAITDWLDFHNEPEKLEDRARMRGGLWPNSSCGYCRRVEQSGGYSDRQNHLDLQMDHNLTPPEMREDPSRDRVTPTMMEVYFSNTCNMACAYCGPHFSSKWEREIERFGEIPQMHKNSDQYAITRTQHNPLYEEHKRLFWQYWHTDHRYRHLRRFMVLGGEPMVQPELMECVDFFMEHPNDALIFEVTTNLKVDPRRYDELLDKIQWMLRNRCIYQFHMNCSLDGWGPQQEYARWGLKLTEWEHNFQRLLGIPGVLCGINSAISAITLREYHTLLDKVSQWNQGRADGDRLLMSFNIDDTVCGPLNVDGSVFAESLDWADEKFPNKTRNEQITHQHWLSISNKIRHNVAEIKNTERLRSFLTELDRRRGTDWRQTYPWLVDC